MMMDADGTERGVYRKSHIPDGPRLRGEVLLQRGRLGFQGVADKGWDGGRGDLLGTSGSPRRRGRWRCRGADLLLYPTAIGSEPQEAGGLETRDMWQRAMIGHAVSNSCYVAAANRVGREGDAVFYGSSFICDYKGEKLAEADESSETVIYAELDFEAAQRFRAGFGFFRDRRPRTL